MQLRLLLLSAPFLGALFLSGPVLAQATAESSSPELLAGLGVGWRENPWHSLDKPTLRALVAMVAIRPAARRILNVEAELGWWQEETARFGTPPDVGEVTTHVLTVGGNLFLMPRAGPFRPRAGVGLHIAYHNDTGSHTLSETLFGGSASVGGEVDLTSRLGAYALVRAEGSGTAGFSRAYGGLRVRLGR